MEMTLLGPESQIVDKSNSTYKKNKFVIISFRICCIATLLIPLSFSLGVHAWTIVYMCVYVSFHIWTANRIMCTQVFEFCFCQRCNVFSLKVDSLNKFTILGVELRCSILQYLKRFIDNNLEKKYRIILFLHVSPGLFVQKYHERIS